MPKQAGSTMASGKDLRGFLRLLEEQGDLAIISRPVDPKHQLAALLKRGAWEKGPALLFTQVKGHEMPVVGNVCASRQRLALALGTTLQDCLAVFMERMAHHVAPQMVEAAPCQEEIRSDLDLLRDLPIITAHELDNGPYITAGVVIAKDPNTGVHNASLHRIHPIGRDRATIFIGPERDLWQYYTRAKELGRGLPVAVVLGVHPALLLATVTELPFDQDELALAGALQQEPLQLVRCRTVDVEVPAASEIVLEGEILPGVLESEGPFGEYTGFYGVGVPDGKANVIQFSALTHRRQPIYQTLITGPDHSYESCYIGCLSKEAVIYSAAKSIIPNIEGVSVLGSRYMGVIQVKGEVSSGNVRRVLLTAMSSMEYIKYVVVVNEDVDIFSADDVLWAMATRVRPSEDILIIPNLTMESLDHSAPGAASAKVGIDATVPQAARKERFQRTRLPGFEEIVLKDWLTVA